MKEGKLVTSKIPPVSEEGVGTQADIQGGGGGGIRAETGNVFKATDGEYAPSSHQNGGLPPSTTILPPVLPIQNLPASR